MFASDLEYNCTRTDEVSNRYCTITTKSVMVTHKGKHYIISLKTCQKISTWRRPNSEWAKHVFPVLHDVVDQNLNAKVVPALVLDHNDKYSLARPFEMCDDWFGYARLHHCHRAVEVVSDVENLLVEWYTSKAWRLFWPMGMLTKASLLCANSFTSFRWGFNFM